MRAADLLQASFTRNVVDDSAYLDFGQCVNWHRLCESDRHTALGEVARVIAFLAQYGSLKWPVNHIALLETLRQVHRAAARFDGCSIEDTALDHELLSQLAAMFEALDAVRGIGSTNASKILHLRLPKLVVMWDEGIERHYREELRVTERPRMQSHLFFANVFLPHMQEEVQQAIDDCQEARGCSRSETVDYLTNEGGQKTLAKLVDEYNWRHYRRGAS